MAEIHVIFPKQGGVAVNSECKLVLKDEYVHWHLYCQDPRVRKVNVRFASDGAGFFPAGDGGLTHEVTKEVEDGATIWGRAPSYPDKLRKDKYTIRGLDQKGEVVAALDPEIITHDPKKP